MPYLPYRPGSGLNLSILDFRSQEKSSFAFYIRFTNRADEHQRLDELQYGSDKGVFVV